MLCWCSRYFKPEYFYPRHLPWLQVGEDCPYVKHGYTEAQLYLKDNIEIRGPHGMYTKQNLGNLFTLHYYKVQ